MEDKQRNLVALILTAPASTIVLVLSTMFGGIIGSFIYVFGKVWQVVVPSFWRLKIEKLPISKSPPPERSIREGIVLGIAMSFVMFIAWLVVGDKINPEEVRSFVKPFGLLNIWFYLAVFFYWVTLNSLLEEYLFRWFIFEKFETLVGGKWAVILAGITFTSHHLFGTAAMFPWWAALLASFGVFIGGVMWSWLYLRHRSIWPCYVSHVIVDITMFSIGAYILFS
ncbi:MAG: type II CAAX endopeptidase family protein [Candidatus Poseidoniaceae archaeon]|nr:type II CAAX endopeptidase family protein [Candidatus Poseidoniaceae archaeon]